MKKQLTFNDIRKKFEELTKNNSVEDVLKMGIFIESENEPKIAIECDVLSDANGRAILIR